MNHLATCHLVKSLLASKNYMFAESLISEDLNQWLHDNAPAMAKGLEPVYIAEYIANLNNN